MNYKLSPSDLTFLYDGCKRCFYLKVKHGISQPSIPLPSIFTKIAGLLKEYYDGKRTEELRPGLSPGIVKYGERFIESKRFDFENHKDTCYIKGRFDVVIEFDDGSYGVIDYKTGNPEGEFSKLYGRLQHPSCPFPQQLIQSRPRFRNQSILDRFCDLLVHERILSLALIPG